MGDAVDDVILGHSYPTMDASAIGRVAALDAGLPVTVTGVQIGRRCGSGLQAVLHAAMQVQTGVSDVLLASGAESMSNAAFYSTALRWGARSGPGVLLHDALARGRVTAGGKNVPVPGGMIETAENLRRDRYLAGPPRRRHRRADPRHPRPGDAAPAGPLRAGNDVHPRRSRTRRRVRAGVLTRRPAIPKTRCAWVAGKFWADRWQGTAAGPTRRRRPGRRAPR